MQTLLLVRGLPNSMAKVYAMSLLNQSKTDCMLATVDEMFSSVSHLDGQGMPVPEYKFNPRLLGAAHDLCYGRAIKGLANGSDVIVQNPFSTKREILRYFKGAARAFPGLDTHVVRVDPIDWDTDCPAPARVVTAMRAKWEDWDGERVIEEFGADGQAVFS